MRTLFAASLVFLAACSTLPHATIQTTVQDRMRIDGLSGEQVQLRNDGPGDLVFELQRGKGPPQSVKIAEGLAWAVALDGLRSIVVTHKGEPPGHMTVTVRGRTGGGIRVLPLPKE
ncbi:MAG: hypothetical protein IPJ19_10965 [Planctomycetes bacterium]|nr:hypothetical protein [Planctomycetota bacterium]